MPMVNEQFVPNFKTQSLWQFIFIGKGLNIWDVFTADGVADGATGQTTCNSYRYYQKDVQALKLLGVINVKNDGL